MSEPAPILNLRTTAPGSDRASAAGAAGAAFLQLLLGLLSRLPQGEGASAAKRSPAGSAASPLIPEGGRGPGKALAAGKPTAPPVPSAAAGRPATEGEGQSEAARAPDGVATPTARSATGGDRPPSWLKLPERASAPPLARSATVDPGFAPAHEPRRLHPAPPAPGAEGTGTRPVAAAALPPAFAENGTAALSQPVGRQEPAGIPERSTSTTSPRPAPPAAVPVGPAQTAVPKLQAGPEAGTSPLAPRGPGSEGPPPARDMAGQAGAPLGAEPGWRPPVVESEAIRFDFAGRGDVAVVRPAPSAVQPSAPALPSPPQSAGTALPAATPESLPYLVLRAQRAGVERLLVQLVPPALGLIEIGIERRADGSLSAVVRSPRKETLERVRGEAGAFVRIFAEQGITLRSEDLRFDLMDEDDDGERERRARDGSAGGGAEVVFSAQLMRALVDLSI